MSEKIKDYTLRRVRKTFPIPPNGQKKNLEVSYELGICSPRTGLNIYEDVRILQGEKLLYRKVINNGLIRECVPNSIFTPELLDSLKKNLPNYVSKNIENLHKEVPPVEDLEELLNNLLSE